jgi:hypothetical protein
MEEQNQNAFDIALHGPCCGPVIESPQPLQASEPGDLDIERPQFNLPCD